MTPRTSPVPKAKRRSPAPKIGIGKDTQDVLYLLPPKAQELLWPVAAQIRQTGLVLLLVKYMLSPQQAVTASVADDGLHADGFDRPIYLNPEDRLTVEEWLGRRRRPRSAQTVSNVLSSKLKSSLVEALEAHEQRTGEWTGWRVRLRVGVHELHRLGAELNGEACDHDEATFKELMHSETADVDDTLRVLTRRSRRVLAEAAALEAEIVRSLMQSIAASQSAQPSGGAAILFTVD